MLSLKMTRSRCEGFICVWSGGYGGNWIRDCMIPMRFESFEMRSDFLGKKSFNIPSITG